MGSTFDSEPRNGGSTGHSAESTSSNLRMALEGNREIGVAVGVLMTVHRVTQAQAFDLLRAASQHSNRKLAAVAQEVVDTGALTLPARAGRPTIAEGVER